MSDRQSPCQPSGAACSNCPCSDGQDHAPEAVALQIARFLERTESERLRLFRLHLQTSIKQVSPLLLDLAELESIPLIKAAGLIYPPADWPGRPFLDYPPTWRSLQLRAWRHVWSRRAEAQFERMFASPGVIIRKFHDPRGRFGIRPCRTVLGFATGLGPCVLTAFSSTAILKLAQRLPETFTASLRGRCLGDIVDHPLFTGRHYRIRSATPDPVDDLTVITFHAKTVAYKGSWA